MTESRWNLKMAVIVSDNCISAWYADAYAFDHMAGFVGDYPSESRTLILLNIDDC